MSAKSYLTEIKKRLQDEILEIETVENEIHIAIRPNKERNEVFELLESAVCELESSDDFTYILTKGTSSNDEKAWVAIVEKKPDSLRKYIPRLAYLNDVDPDSEFYLTVANGCEGIDDRVQRNHKEWATRVFFEAYKEQFNGDEPSNTLSVSVSEENSKELENIIGESQENSGDRSDEDESLLDW